MYNQFLQDPQSNWWYIVKNYQNGSLSAQHFETAYSGTSIKQNVMGLGKLLRYIKGSLYRGSFDPYILKARLEDFVCYTEDFVI